MGILDRDVNSRKDKVEVKSSDHEHRPTARVTHHRDGRSTLHLNLYSDTGASANSHLDELLKRVEAKREQEETKQDEQ